MKLLSFIRKTIFIFSIVPFFSLASLYADPANLIARGEFEHRQGGAGQFHSAAHPAARQDFSHNPEFNRGLATPAYTHGVEAGAVEGAAIGGAATNGAVNAAPLYVAPQPVQYTTPTPLPPQ